MKKISLFILIILIITSGLSPVSATNETEQNLTITESENEEVKIKNESDRIGETVTTNSDGYLNITFDDGYNGYCIDHGWNAASPGDKFTVQNTSTALNNRNGNEIGNYLKILFVDYHDFVTENKKETQNIIWGFSDNYYSNNKNSEIINEIKNIAKNGRVIADHGETININNTTKAIFDFEVLNSGRYHYQSFFGYKITYETIINDILGSPENNDTTQNQTNPENNNTTTQNQTNPENNNTTTQNQTNPENNTNMSEITEIENETVKNNEKNNSNNITNLNDGNKLTQLHKHVTGNELLIFILVVALVGIIYIKHKRD